jgi:succinoglycan biosynthesis transport protein ExoP
MIAEKRLTTHDPRLLTLDVGEERVDGPVSQARIVAHVLARRWRLVGAFVAAGVLGMALVTLLTERRYTATAVVHIENDMPHVTKIDQVVAQPSYLESVEYFQDQVSLLKSRTLIASVIRELRLHDDPHFKAAPPGLLARTFQGAIGLVVRLGGTAPAPRAAGDQPGRPGSEEGVPTWAIDRYNTNLEVKPVPNSRLVQVRVTARDPDLAQAIANAHANGYIRRTLQAKFELTGEARKYLEQEIERVRQEVDRSETALDQFRREHGIVAADDAQGNAVVERLGDLTRRLTNAQAQRIELEAQHDLVQNRDFESLPAVIQNALIQNMKADLSRLEAHEAELSRIFLDGNPELQQVRAQVRQTRARLQQEVSRTVAGVESQYLAAKNTEDALRAELERQQGTVLDLKQISGQYVKLDQAVQANRALYAALLQRAGETEVVRGVQLSNISVLDPAERPTMPSRPNAVLNVVFGLVLGLVLGIGTAAILENVDTSIKTPADVERVLALPTLGVIPDFRRVGTPDLAARRRLADRRGGVPAPAGTSIAAEVFRTLRTSILFFDPEHPPRTVLVTSSQAGEGKTATVVNLALSLAQQGARVLLIDADMRKPRCHHALGLPEGTGLSDYLLGETDFADVTRALPLPGARGANGHGGPRPGAELQFVPSGRVVQQTAELLSSPRMRTALAAAAERYDIVLVDSPPMFPVADASLVATMVDGVVLVVRGERTPRHLTREAIARLRFMQAKVLGVVLNGVNPSHPEYAYRYAYYFQDAVEA